jgi:hypothetical protein
VTVKEIQVDPDEMKELAKTSECRSLFHKKILRDWSPGGGHHGTRERVTVWQFLVGVQDPSFTTLALALGFCTSHQLLLKLFLDLPHIFLWLNFLDF